MEEVWIQYQHVTVERRTARWPAIEHEFSPSVAHDDLLRAADARVTLRALGAETVWIGDHSGYDRIESKANIAGPDFPPVFDTAHGLPAVEPNSERRDAWLRGAGRPASSPP